MKWLVKRPVTEREIISSKSKRRREKKHTNNKKTQHKKNTFSQIKTKTVSFCVYIYIGIQMTQVYSINSDALID